jgi:hypothetical protein
MGPFPTCILHQTAHLIHVPRCNRVKWRRHFESCGAQIGGAYMCIMLTICPSGFVSTEKAPLFVIDPRNPCGPFMNKESIIFLLFSTAAHTQYKSPIPNARFVTLTTAVGVFLLHYKPYIYPFTRLSSPPFEEVHAK